ncbi:hypothetical protein QTI66_39380 [Variovorax sp. J22R133]|uniref:hypothetical protein n=1 Tax=Variovorax brevis TaxID=3053503 RepID=UPI002575FA27|nr:hypothetical protein [Variovorax sp. J22R133]MDM0118132.1 hypothetical protein [Variovorax sp. J22R133]
MRKPAVELDRELQAVETLRAAGYQREAEEKLDATYRKFFTYSELLGDRDGRKLLASIHILRAKVLSPAGASEEYLRPLKLLERDGATYVKYKEAILRLSAITASQNGRLFYITERCSAGWSSCFDVRLAELNYNLINDETLARQRLSELGDQNTNDPDLYLKYLLIRWQAWSKLAVPWYFVRDAQALEESVRAADLLLEFSKRFASPPPNVASKLEFYKLFVIANGMNIRTTSSKGLETTEGLVFLPPGSNRVVVDWNRWRELFPDLAQNKEFENIARDVLFEVWACQNAYQNYNKNGYGAYETGGLSYRCRLMYPSANVDLSTMRVDPNVDMSNFQKIERLRS